ncbi:MAG: riboflavin synthase subunit alpha [Acinetobacter populi]|jgi:riboflavin synthase|uniref:riboflavin synthase subunit alpha n=1 Tax=Acinetobacter populi TaxID=1582270 RepID=UPI0023524A67|nr:riboflavin synthase subunit alpha [Acinetobacter populi]MCH4249131.1 riboflavin synthase subunit alpha [Acinetobacter populi]
MYTGIVMGVERIQNIQLADGYRTIFVSNTQGLFDDVFIGASVAIDGVCLTVTQISEDLQLIAFDISDVSNALTTLQFLQKDSPVNVERSFKVGMENGGHSLYGHIEGMAQIKQLQHHGATLHLDIAIPAEKMKYFFHKGFIGLHGCSLTVNNVDKVQHLVSVDLIPETLRLTNLKFLQQGDFVNFEIDHTTRTLVDTIEGIYANRL